MNRKRMIPKAIILGSLVAFAACNKEEPTPSGPTSPGGNNGGSGSSLNFTPSAQQLDLFQKNILDNSRQSFTINIDNPTQITGLNGTKIQFNAGSLVDAQGNTVSGNVNISLVEALTEADMILLNKPTIGDNNGNREPLVTGGEILLDVTQNGQNLFLGQGQKVMIDIPTDNPDFNMDVFTAGANADTNIWQNLGDSTQLAVILDTSSNSSFYSFFCDSIRWINCDYFASFQGAKTDLIMQLPEGLDVSNTRNYIMLKNQDMVVGYFGTSADNMPFLNQGYQIPVGFEAHFITLAVDSNGDLFANIQSNTIAQDHEENIQDLVEMTEAQLKQAINALD